MTPSRSPVRPARSERELVGVLASWFRSRGWKAYIDPDGGSYFDLVVRRQEEVGLVEAKVGEGRRVVRQALERRIWGDWAAVAVLPPRTAAGVAARTAVSRAASLGVLTLEEGAVRELRAARPWAVPAEPDPFAPLRSRFRGVLDALDRGELPEGPRWSDVVREVHRASNGRGFGEWRLDEPGPLERRA